MSFSYSANYDAEDHQSARKFYRNPNQAYTVQQRAILEKYYPIVAAECQHINFAAKSIEPYITGNQTLGWFAKRKIKRTLEQEAHLGLLTSCNLNPEDIIQLTKLLNAQKYTAAQQFIQNKSADKRLIDALNGLVKLTECNTSSDLRLAFVSEQTAGVITQVKINIKKDGSSAALEGTLENTRLINKDFIPFLTHYLKQKDILYAEKSFLNQDIETNPTKAKLQIPIDLSTYELEIELDRSDEIRLNIITHPKIDLFVNNIPHTKISDTLILKKNKTQVSETNPYANIEIEITKPKLVTMSLHNETLITNKIIKSLFNSKSAREGQEFIRQLEIEYLENNKIKLDKKSVIPEEIVKVLAWHNAETAIDILRDANSKNKLIKDSLSDLLIMLKKHIQIPEFKSMVDTDPDLTAIWSIHEATEKALHNSQWSIFNKAASASQQSAYLFAIIKLRNFNEKLKLLKSTRLMSYLNRENLLELAIENENIASTLLRPPLWLRIISIFGDRQLPNEKFTSEDFVTILGKHPKLWNIVDKTKISVAGMVQLATEGKTSELKNLVLQHILTHKTLFKKANDEMKGGMLAKFFNLLPSAEKTRFLNNPTRIQNLFVEESPEVDSLALTLLDNSLFCSALNNDQSLKSLFNSHVSKEVLLKSISAKQSIPRAHTLDLRGDSIQNLLEKLTLDDLENLFDSLPISETLKICEALMALYNTQTSFKNRLNKSVKLLCHIAIQSEPFRNFLLAEQGAELRNKILTSTTHIHLITQVLQQHPQLFIKEIDNIIANNELSTLLLNTESYIQLILADGNFSIDTLTKCFNAWGNNDKFLTQLLTSSNPSHVIDQIAQIENTLVQGTTPRGSPGRETGFNLNDLLLNITDQTVAANDFKIPFARLIRKLIEEGPNKNNEFFFELFAKCEKFRYKILSETDTDDFDHLKIPERLKYASDLPNTLSKILAGCFAQTCKDLSNQSKTDYNEYCKPNTSENTKFLYFKHIQTINLMRKRISTCFENSVMDNLILASDIDLIALNELSMVNFKQDQSANWTVDTINSGPLKKYFETRPQFLITKLQDFILSNDPRRANEFIAYLAGLDLTKANITGDLFKLYMENPDIRTKLHEERWQAIPKQLANYFFNNILVFIDDPTFKRGCNDEELRQVLIRYADPQVLAEYITLRKDADEAAGFLSSPVMCRKILEVPPGPKTLAFYNALGTTQTFWNMVMGNADLYTQVLNIPPTRTKDNNKILIKVCFYMSQRGDAQRIELTLTKTTHPGLFNRLNNDIQQPTVRRALFTGERQSSPISDSDEQNHPSLRPVSIRTVATPNIDLPRPIPIQPNIATTNIDIPRPVPIQATVAASNSDLSRPRPDPRAFLPTANRSSSSHTVSSSSPKTPPLDSRGFPLAQQPVNQSTTVTGSSGSTIGSLLRSVGSFFGSRVTSAAAEPPQSRSRTPSL